MTHCYFDTSALVKRYYAESGTAIVGRLVDKIISGEIKGVTLSIAVAELISTINRKKNEGLLDKQAFDKLLTILYAEVDHFAILPLDDQKVVESIPRIIKHNLNSTDAIHLTAASMARQSSGSQQTFFFVCCDKRLLTAAKREGLKVLNPEVTEVKSLKSLFR